MRLGQLARKLALRPTEIVEFLAENQIQIGEGANTRLEQHQMILVMKRFVPGWEEVKEEVVEAALSEITEAQKEENEETKDQISAETVNPEQTPLTENIEIIKAPKIELAGLKVLGKIELPELKKKDTASEPDAVESVDGEPVAAEVEKKTFKRERKKFDENRRRDNRLQKNPVTMQREMEAKEAQRKRDEQIARDKEKKTQNYLKKVKTPPAVKAVKLVKEPVMQMTAKELEEPPKTLWGKILRWLTKAS